MILHLPHTHHCYQQGMQCGSHQWPVFHHAGQAVPKWTCLIPLFLFTLSLEIETRPGLLWYLWCYWSFHPIGLSSTPPPPPQFPQSAFKYFLCPKQITKFTMKKGISFNQMVFWLLVSLQTINHFVVIEYTIELQILWLFFLLFM